MKMKASLYFLKYLEKDLQAVKFTYIARYNLFLIDKVLGKSLPSQHDTQQNKLTVAFTLYILIFQGLTTLSDAEEKIQSHVLRSGGGE